MEDGKSVASQFGGRIEDGCSIRRDIKVIDDGGIE